MHDPYQVKTLRGDNVTLIASQVKEVSFKLLHPGPGYQVTVFGESYQSDMRIEADAEECKKLKQWLNANSDFYKNGYGRWFRNRPLESTKNHFILKTIHGGGIELPSLTTDIIDMHWIKGDSASRVSITKLGAYATSVSTVTQEERLRLTQWLREDGQFFVEGDGRWLNGRHRVRTAQEGSPRAKTYELVTTSNNVVNIEIGNVDYVSIELAGNAQNRYRVNVSLPQRGQHSVQVTRQGVNLLRDWLMHHVEHGNFSMSQRDGFTVWAQRSPDDIPIFLTEQVREALKAEVHAELDKHFTHHLPGRVSLRDFMNVDLGQPYDEQRVPGVESIALSNDALECLRDVVSHAGDFRDALGARLVKAREDDYKQTGVSEPVEPPDSGESYWTHQQNVFERMVKQATAALALHDKVAAPSTSQEN